MRMARKRGKPSDLSLVSTTMLLLFQSHIAIHKFHCYKQKSVGKFHSIQAGMTKKSSMKMAADILKQQRQYSSGKMVL